VSLPRFGAGLLSRIAHAPTPKLSLAYTGAVAAAALGTAIRWVLGLLVGPGLPPFITYYPLVVLAALYGGVGPGLVATALAALAVTYFFLPPIGSFAVAEGAGKADLICFCVVSVVSSVICGALRAARQRTYVEARRAEASEERFRLLFETSPLSTFLVDPATQRIMDCNEQTAQALGYTREQLRGLRIPDIEAHFTPEEVTGMVGQVAGGARLTFETCLRTRSGELRNVILSARAFTLQGHAVHYATAVDITERNRAAKALRESEQRALLAVETAALGTYERDLLTNEVIMNPVCCSIMGVQDEHLPPDIARRSVHPDDAARILELAARSFNPALREVCSGEFRILRPDGSIRWVAGRGRVIFDDRANPPRPLKFIGVLNDITQQKIAQENLARANEKLESVVRERTAKLREMVTELEHFSYTITHDMRAPLRAIAGYTSMLTDGHAGTLSDDAHDLLRRVLDSAHRMDQLITDALRYSQVVRQKLELQPLDPTATVRGLVESYPQFHPPHAQVSVQPDMPLVLANQAALTQVFSNLLGNAVKFVAPGLVPQVTVSAERRGEFVRISVKDNGIGVPAEYHDKVWQMFERLNTNYEGTGIGLALVRKVVERMDGNVGLESAPGQGSQFWVELRAA
jgi:PAS domain S-box-containing protein